VPDCDGACAPTRRFGNGFCDDGTAQAWGDFNYNCEAWLWDNGDCTPPDTDTDAVACAPGQIPDCAGLCAPASRLGGGCDDGPGPFWGDFDFNCAQFAWDNGACGAPDTGDTDPAGCPAGQIPDCLGNCAPEARLGGGCDDGPGPFWGDFDFNCRQFDWDNGACDLPDSATPVDTDPCPPGQIPDCSGVCAPSSRLGGGCDDGPGPFWGEYDFNCRAFDWDEGACDLPDSATPEDTAACPPGQVADCLGHCAPEVRLGGICDDGPGPAWGDFDFNCRQFAWDEGACDLPDSAAAEDTAACPPGQVADGLGNCAPEVRVGGICDDGPGPAWGDFDFNCREFSWDNGACDLPDSAEPQDTSACAPGQLLDCDGAGAPASRLGG
jgi:hypothetical protein